MFFGATWGLKRSGTDVLDGVLDGPRASTLTDLEVALSFRDLRFALFSSFLHARIRSLQGPVSRALESWMQTTVA